MDIVSIVNRFAHSDSSACFMLAGEPERYSGARDMIGWTTCGLAAAIFGLGGSESPPRPTNRKSL